MKRTRPLPRFNTVAVAAFESAFYFAKLFGLSRIHWSLPKTSLDPSRPVLLFANHASNFDGFLCRTLQKKVRPGVPTFSLMLAREMKRLPLFKWLGGVAVEPGSGASLTAALRDLRTLRAETPGMFLTVFPQGKIFPPYRRPQGFQGGIVPIARALAPVTLLPIAFDYQLLGNLRPQAFVYAGAPIVCDREEDVPTAQEMERIQTALLDELQAILAERGEAFGGFP